MCELITSSRISLLLDEYKLAADRSDKYSALIWQLGTLLLTLSSGGIVFVNRLDDNTIEGYIFVTILSYAVMFGLWFWNRVANRWNSYIIAWHFRIKEIEATPGIDMWANRYIDIVDKINTKRDISTEEVFAAESLKCNINGIEKISTESIKTLRNQLVWVMGVSWLSFLAFKGYSTWSKIKITHCPYSEIYLENTYILPISIFITITILLPISFCVYMKFKNPIEGKAIGAPG